MIKYLVKFDHYKTDEALQEIQVENVTDKSYWVNGSRRDKSTSCYGKLFDTHKEAFDYGLQMWDKKIQHLQSQLDSAKALKQNFNNTHQKPQQ